MFVSGHLYFENWRTWIYFISTHLAFLEIKFYFFNKKIATPWILVWGLSVVYQTKEMKGEKPIFKSGLTLRIIFISWASVPFFSRAWLSSCFSCFEYLFEPPSPVFFLTFLWLFEEAVTGTSNLQSVTTQVATWACNWHLKQRAVLWNEPESHGIWSALLSGQCLKEGCLEHHLVVGGEDLPHNIYTLEIWVPEYRLNGLLWDSSMLIYILNL